MKISITGFGPFWLKGKNARSTHRHPSKRSPVVMAVDSLNLRLLPLRRFEGVDSNQILEHLHIRLSGHKVWMDDWMMVKVVVFQMF